MSAPGDLLLRWASENGSGSLADLKQGMWWLAAKSCPDLEPGAAGRWLRDLVALGHLDIDWRNRRWCAAPPVATRIPGGIGIAVVAGSRTAAFDSLLAQAADFGLNLLRASADRPERDIPLPDSVLLQYEDPEDLAEFAGSLGADLVPCFALQAAGRLRPMGQGEPAASPQYGEPLELYDLDRCQYLPVQRPRSDGLYRFRRRDSRQVCQLMRGSSWYEVAHEVGVFHELRDRSSAADVMRWIPEHSAGREGFGRLHTDWGYPLPDLQRRIAVLCSGLAPQIHEKSQNIAYDNVPIEVARRIGDSLGQQLGDF